MNRMDLLNLMKAPKNKIGTKAPITYTKTQARKKEPLWLKALNVALRPQRAITGLLSNVTDKDSKTTALGGFLGGLSGKERKDTSQVLSNVGWKQNEADGEYSFLKGQKGKFDLFDIASFLGDVALDPTTYLTLGGSSAYKAGAKSAYEAVKKAGFDIAPAITGRGQRLAIKEVAQKQSDDVLSRLAPMVGDNRVLKTTGAGADTAGRTVDEGLQMVNGVKAEAQLSPELAMRLAEKKRKDVMTLAENAAKEGRKKGQNALINIDVPFFNILYQFGRKPKFLTVADPVIGAAQISTLNKLFDEAGVTESQRKVLQDPKTTKEQAMNILKRIGFSAEKKKDFLNKAFGVEDFSKLTIQQLREAQRRIGDVGLFQLDNLGSSVTKKQVESMLPAQQNIENIKKQMEVLMSTKYTNEMEDLRKTNPNLTDSEIIDKVIQEVNLPRKTGSNTVLDLPVDVSTRTSPFGRSKKIPKEVRDLMDSVRLKLESTGVKDDVLTEQFLDIIKRISQKAEDTPEFKKLVKTLSDKRKQAVAKLTTESEKRKAKMIKGMKNQLEQKKKVEFEKINKLYESDKAKIIEKYKKEYDALKNKVMSDKKLVPSGKNVTKEQIAIYKQQRAKYLEGLKREWELRRKAELDKLDDTFKAKKKSVEDTLKKSFEERMTVLNKGFKSNLQKSVNAEVKTLDEEAEILKKEKTKELTESSTKRLEETKLQLNNILGRIDEDILKTFGREVPTYKNIVSKLQKDLRNPAEYKKVGYDKLLNETILANPKGVRLDQIKKPQMLDVVETKAIELAPNKNFRNVDESRFVTDMGGQSPLGAALRRSNIFNIRTFNSTDAVVEEIASMVRDYENRMSGRRRDIEKQVANLLDYAKNLTEEEKQLIPYIIQKMFPDKYIEGVDFSTILQSLAVKKSELDDLNMLFKAKKDAGMQKIKQIRLDIKVAKQAKDSIEVARLEKQIEDIKNTFSTETKYAKSRELKAAIASQELKVKNARMKNQPDVDDVLNRVTGGDAGRIEQIKTVVARFEQLFDDMKKQGIKSKTLEQVRKNYYPHVISLDDASFKELVKKFENDPEIGELIKKSSANQFGKERKTFQTLAELDNKVLELEDGLESMRNTIPTLIDGSPQQVAMIKKAKDTQEKVDALSTLFERDPFKALTKRAYKNIKSTAMKELQEQLYKDGMLLPASKVAPDGYTKLTPEQSFALGLPRDSILNTEVLEGMERVRKVFTDKGLENVLRIGESVTNMWKTVTTSVVPSHYWFNFVGNLSNNTMAGIGVDAYLEASKLMRAHKNGTLTPQQRQIISDALDNGVLNQTSYADILGTSSAALSGESKLYQIEKAFVDNPLTRAARTYVGDPIDNYFRLAHYVGVLGKTNSPKLAAESVRKYLFNYSELTRADRAMKVVAPFWNWTKNNIPLQLHQLFVKPRYAQQYVRLKDQTQGDVANDPNVPDWLKEQYIRVGDNSFYNLRLPLSDLSMLYGFDSETLNRVMGMQSPFLRVIQETALNKQYFGNKYVDYGKQETGTYDASKYGQYLLNQTGIIGRTAKFATQDIPNKEDEKTVMDNIRDFLMGKTVGIKK